MEFGFTEEQKMTADVVRGLLADECTTADLRRMLAAEEARSETRWAKLSELGLATVLVPEAAGGLGLAETDFVLVAEECGRAGLPEPLVEHAGIAVPMLAGIDHPRAAAALERALGGEGTLVTGHPLNPFVADADTADLILLAKDGEVHLVERGAVRLTRQTSIDPFRRLFRVDAALGADTRIADAATGAPLWAAALERGALWSAAQMLGIAQRQVAIAVEYANQRTQFGKIIGSYQAIKHHLATVQVKIEFARPVLYAAAGGFDPADLASRTRISHAKLAAGAAADLASTTAVQVHGAMGYSWEVDVQFFLKRALALTGAWGDRNFHMGRVAHRLFATDLPLGADRTFATEGQNHAA
jgi:alkylation response protein AidB-like acyl-CoA dehydrogenase